MQKEFLEIIWASVVFIMLELDNLQWRTAKGEPKLDENKRETWGPTDDSYY